MLPPLLASAYKEYKKDTNAVAAWLASTAKSRGYSSNIDSASAASASGAAPTTSSPAAPKRLKGKARKEAKVASQQAAQASSASPSRPQYVIAIKDFVPLAKFIAACKKPAVSVPLSLANTLNRVITTRSGFGKRLATSTGNSSDANDAAEDSNHAYFVGILEEVREVLLPLLAPITQEAAPRAATPPAPVDPVGEVGGRFAGLSVEDPSEAFLNAPDIDRPTPAKNDKATYEAERPKDTTEIMFAYNLLLNDLNAIRDRIAWIWTKYKAGEFDLISAAIATNTACDLARKLTEEMTPMFEPHGGVVEIAKRFFSRQCFQMGFLAQYPSLAMSDRKCETYDVADRTYAIAIIILEKTDQIFSPGCFPVFEHPSFDTYDHSADWASMPRDKKFKNDNTVMLEFFCELSVMMQHYPGLFAADELTRGVQELSRTKEISMSLVFAAQVFLDIHHILRDKVFSSHKECMSHLAYMEEDLKLHIDFFAEGSTKGWPYTNVDVFKEFRRQINIVQDDPIQKAKIQVTASRGRPLACPLPKQSILKYSPVISGLFLYSMRQRMYNTSLELANMTSSILYPLHLYNALRQEKLLSSDEMPSGCWEDMEVLRRLLGDESFFVGQPPRDQPSYMKSLLVQTGLSVATFSKNKKYSAAMISNRMTSKAGVRLIKLDRAPVSSMFIDRYVMETGQVDWTPADVESVISRSIHHENGGRGSNNGIIEFGALQAPGRPPQRKQARPSKDVDPQMTPEKLIESLVIALHAESLTLTFPYLTLQRSAWGMLRAVRDACEQLVLQTDGALYIKDERQLPGIVYLILWELRTRNNKLFLKAGEAMKEQLRRGEGKKAIQRLKGMGHVVVTQTGQTINNPETGTYYLDIDAR